MPVTTKIELIEVLIRGDFNSLVGTAESDHIEFKGRAYRQQDPRSGRDLLADVASFANSGGGMIVMGVETSRDPSNHRDIATDGTGICAEVDIDAYGQFLRAHIHPPVKGIEFRRYSGTIAERAITLFAILVEAQRETDRPFLVDRSILIGDVAVTHAFGWPTRVGESTHWESAGRVQSLIWQGLRGPGDAASQHSNSEAESATHLEIIEGLDGWNDWANYFVQLVPDQTGEIEDFWGTFQARVVRWQGLRNGGFNLNLSSNPVGTVAGGRGVYEAASNAVVVSRSGVVTAGMAGSPDSLGWAQHPVSVLRPDEVRINPIVLVEYTAEAIRFAYECVGLCASVSSWSVRAAGRHLLERVPVGLPSNFSTRRTFPIHANPALANEFDVEIRSQGDFRVDACRLLYEVYGVGFALGQESVPSVRNGRIDLGVLGGL